MERRFQFCSLQSTEADAVDFRYAKIRDICEDFGSQRWSEELILAYGRLLTLFGPPLFVSENMEDEYSYCIQGKDKQGAEVYLEVYSGPSGPSIGGKQGKVERQAADELAELIMCTAPTDYEYTGYYLDGPSKVHKAVRNGKPFMEECELTEEEFKTIAEKLYND